MENSSIIFNDNVCDAVLSDVTNIHGCVSSMNTSDSPSIITPPSFESSITLPQLHTAPASNTLQLLSSNALGPVLPGLQRRIDDIIQLAQAYGRLASPSITLKQINIITSVVLEAFATTDMVYGAERAAEWAKGFSFPPEVYTRDLEELRALDFDLSALILQRQMELLPERLNHDRVNRWALEDPTDPDLERLRSLVDGIVVVTDPNYVPDPIPPSIPSVHEIAASAVFKNWHALWEERIALLIPTREIRSKADPKVPLEGAISYTRWGWSPKFGKLEGRCTSNASYDNKRGGKLNTDYVREHVRLLYGDIVLPTIDEIMRLAILESIRLGGWEHVVLWKMDLKGAFNLLFFRHDKAGLLCHEFSEGITLVNLVGNFGWTGLPFAFGVVTRTILRRLRRLLKGSITMFVDDLMGICGRSEVDECIRIAKEVVCSLLGPNAINHKKTIPGSRQLDFIGWLVDLDILRIGVARHNYLKALYGFLSVEEGTALTVKEVQSLASRASRYSLVCRYMLPFSHVLHTHSSGYRNDQVKIRVMGDLWSVIRLWRMYLVLMELNPIDYTRDIRSFAPVTPRVFVNMDASLKGFGILVWTLKEGESWPVGHEGGALPAKHQLQAVVGYTTPYQLNGDSSFQNAMEFTCTVVSLALLVSLGYRDISILLQGDSKSALAWCLHRKFRVGNCQAAAVAFIQASMQCGIDIHDVAHLPGVLQKWSDPLSRGVNPRRVCMEAGFPLSVIRTVGNNPALNTLIHLMDPSELFDLGADLPSRWTAIESLLRTLSLPGGGWI